MAAPTGDEAELINNDDGYKAPEKKTIEELQKLDAEDESLQRYKEKLLGAVGEKPAPICKRVASFFICLL